MAVNKELLARYKELKAQGVNVSLAELKAQMEEENYSVATPNYEQPTPAPTPVRTGFSALTSTPQAPSIQPAPTPIQTPEPTYYQQPQQQYVEPNYNEPQPQQNSAWSNSYYSQTEPVVTPESYSNSYKTEHAVNTTTYSSLYQTPLEPTVDTQQPQQKTPYTGNVHSFDIPTEENNIKKYCLIGYPLGHSLSTYIHNAGFQSLGINSTYEILETPPETLVDRIKYLKYNNFAGFNVTIPLKLPVTLFLDEIDASADIVGAVNTVEIRPDKTLKGYNTDVMGFYNAIPKDFTIAGKTAGVLGTGGAARAAITALAQNQIKKINIFTRNVPNSIEFLNFLRSKFSHTEFNAFQIERIRDLSDLDILVNTTPIGMQGRGADYTPVEENELKTLPPHAIVYDVIYNPKKTILLKLAQKNGYRTINGVDMFIHQAVAAQQIWTGRTPDFKDMKIAALENL